MKKHLPIFLIFAMIAGSTLHRGGISFQMHLLWTVSLLPLIALTYWQRKTQTLSTGIIALTLLLLLTIAIGWTNSTMKDFGLISISGLFSGLVLLLTTAQIDVTENEGEKLLKALSLFAALLSIFGTIMYIATPLDRISSTFLHLPYLSTSYPNAFALFLFALLPIPLLNLENKLWFSVSIIMGASLLLTFSRSSYIAVIFIIATLFITKKITINKKSAALFMAIALLTISIQFLRPNILPSNTFREKLTLQSDEKISSVSERLAFWNGALAIIKNYPMTGTGPDTFRFHFPFYHKELLANADHPHNFILKQAVEFGIPSALLLISLIAIILYRARSLTQTNLGTAIFLSIGGMIIHNLLDDNLNFVSNASLFWLLLGLLISLSPKTNPAPTRAVKAVSILLATILLIAGSYEIYQRNLIVRARSVSTEKAFENIKPIFYEDALLLKAGNMSDNTAKKMLQQATKHNTRFARAENLLSEIYLKEGNKTEAKKYSDLALKYDSYNDLRYHYHKLLIESPLQTEEKLYIELLKNYLELLNRNAHETIRSDNPLYAIKIAALLEKNTKSRLRRLTFAKLRKDLLATTTLERKKFEAFSRIKLAPLQWQ